MFAQWENSWKDGVDQWVKWLSAFESTAHTWLANQTFNNPVSFPGGVTGDTVATGKFSALGSGSLFQDFATIADLNVGGDANVSGDATVTGVLHANGGIALPAGVNLTYSGTWVDNGGGYGSGRYWNDGQGCVELDGAAKNPNTGSLALATLPVGNRPPALLAFKRLVYNGGTYDTVNITISALGVITVNGYLTANSQVDLNGIRFRTT